MKNTVHGRPTIGIVLDSMWPIKDYILSGAFQDWSEKFNLVALVHPKYSTDTKRLIEALGLDVRIHSLRPFEPSQLLQLTYRLQKSLLYERHDIQTEKLVQKRSQAATLRARSPLENWMSRLMRVLAKSPLAGLLDVLFARVRRWLTPRGFYAADFGELGLEVLFITDPTNRALDPLYFGGVERGIPVTSLVLSWDNLTTKGIIHRGYARLMLWNEVMHEEAKKMYPFYGADRRRVVGFPRFDVYKRPPPANFDRESFLSGLGLDPGKRTVLLASANIRAFKNQVQVFRHVCEARQAGVFPPDVQILVRCHPLDVREEYAPLTGFPGVAIWPSAARNESVRLYDQVPDKDELNILSATFRHSDVCVAAGSSVMFDAAVCDIPIVCIAYDGDVSLPYHDSVASAYEFSHQKPLHDLGATDICRSREALIEAISASLQHPGKRAAQRQALVGKYLCEVGTASAKIGEVLVEIAPRGTSPRTEARVLASRMEVS